MILLIAPSSRAQEYAAALEVGVGQRVQLASSLRSACTLLRSEEYTAVVVDQAVYDTEPDAELVASNSGAAVPTYVNLAISCPARVVREVKVRIRRANSARLAARKDAQESLRAGLRGAVTGILLSSELAMQTPQLPPSVQGCLETVHELACEMRKQLGA